MAILDKGQIKNFEVCLVGDMLGGKFNYNSKLNVTKYKKAIKRPEDKAWNEEVENKQKQFMKQKVRRTVKKSQIPKGAKILGFIWSMKKKADGTLQGRLRAHILRQKDGEHYDSSLINIPV